MLDDIEAVVGAVRAGSAARAILKVILECGSLGEANTAVRQQRIAEGCVLSVRTAERSIERCSAAEYPPRALRITVRFALAAGHMLPRRLSVLVFIL